MKLSFKTTTPLALKNQIIKLIEDNKLETWEIHIYQGVKYLKHIGQWSEKGVVKLTIDDNQKTLVAEILKFKNHKEEVKDFEGYYLGRFCELIFVNLSDKFTSINKSE